MPLIKSANVLFVFFAVVFVSCSNADAQQAEMKKQLAREAAIKAIELATESLDGSWTSKAGANLVAAHPNLGNLDQAMELLERHKLIAGDQSINAAMKFTKRTNDLQLMHRLVKMIDFTHRSWQGACEELIRHCVEANDWEPVLELLSKPGELWHREKFASTAIDHFCRVAAKEAIERNDLSIAKITEVVQTIETVTVKIYKRIALATMLVELGDLETAKKLLPTESEFQAFEKACDKLTPFVDPDEKSKQAQEWYSNFRFHDHQKNRLLLARLAIELETWRLDNSSKTEKDFRKLSGQLSEKYRADRVTAVRMFLLAGLNDLAIEEGLKLDRPKHSRPRTNIKKSTDPFRFINRQPVKRFGSWERFQPLFELLDTFVLNGELEKAWQLAQSMTDPLWQAMALNELLRSPKCNDVPRRNEIPDMIHAIVIGLKANDYFPLDAIKQERHLFVNLLQNNRLEQALEYLKDFGQERNSSRILVPVVAHYLFANGKSDQATKMIEVTPYALRQVTAYNLIKELCYDDEYETALEIFDSFVEEESKLPPACCIAASSLRGGSEETLMSVLDESKNQPERLIGFMFTLTRAARQ